MSHWSAMPERSSTREPGNTGELTHSSRCSWWPGVQADTEERVAEVAVDDALQLPTDCPTCSAPYHSATAAKYGATSRST